MWTCPILQDEYVCGSESSAAELLTLTCCKQAVSRTGMAMLCVRKKHRQEEETCPLCRACVNVAELLQCDSLFAIKYAFVTQEMMMSAAAANHKHAPPPTLPPGSQDVFFSEHVHEEGDYGEDGDDDVDDDGDYNLNRYADWNAENDDDEDADNTTNQEYSMDYDFWDYDDDDDDIEEDEETRTTRSWPTLAHGRDPVNYNPAFYYAVRAQ